jgi:hypothetical protein
MTIWAVAIVGVQNDVVLVGHDGVIVRHDVVIRMPVWSAWNEKTVID